MGLQASDRPQLNSMADWWEVQKTSAIATRQTPLKGHWLPNQRPWLAKASVASAQQVSFSLCSIPLPSLPHRICLWVTTVASLKQTHLRVCAQGTKSVCCSVIWAKLKYIPTAYLMSVTNVILPAFNTYFLFTRDMLYIKHWVSFSGFLLRRLSK